MSEETRTWLIIFLGILFLYNAFKFLRSEGSKNSILSTLFNMVIFLFIIIIIIHKNSISKKGFKQTILDYYFTIK